MNKNEVFEQLKIDEGVKYEIYNDHLGYPTFGVGHLVLETDPEYGQPTGTAITKERVAEWFDNDLSTAISECHALYGQGAFDDLPDEVQGILVNMMFNMGRTRLSKFKKMNEWLQKGNWKAAAVEGRDSVWYKQVTNRAERLVKRMREVS